MGVSRGGEEAEGCDYLHVVQGVFPNADLSRYATTIHWANRTRNEVDNAGQHFRREKIFTAYPAYLCYLSTWNYGLS